MSVIDINLFNIETGAIRSSLQKNFIGIDIESLKLVSALIENLNRLKIDIPYDGAYRNNALYEKLYKV